MARAAPAPADVTTTSGLDGLLASWRRHLIAQRMSPATLFTYSASVHHLTGFLTAPGMPRAPGSIPREDGEHSSQICSKEEACCGAQSLPSAPVAAMCPGDIFHEGVSVVPSMRRAGREIEHR